jgi:hypothetical protein
MQDSQPADSQNHRSGIRNCHALIYTIYAALPSSIYQPDFGSVLFQSLLQQHQELRHSGRGLYRRPDAAKEVARASKRLSFQFTQYNNRA